MKKKTIWRFALALALVVSTVGTATSAFAATSVPMEPVTKIATENEDAIWEQIEAVEEKSDAIFQRNAALWEKLDEICNALPEDYDFTNFDEAAFIRNTDALTEAEKETLLADIKELNELDAQMERCMRSCPTATICRFTRRHWKRPTPRCWTRSTPWSRSMTASVKSTPTCGTR